MPAASVTVTSVPSDTTTPGHRAFGRGDDAVDRGAFGRSEVEFLDDVDVDLADRFFACVPPEVGGIGAGLARVG